MTEFAAREGVSAQRLHRWRQRLGVGAMLRAGDRATMRKAPAIWLGLSRLDRSRAPWERVAYWPMPCWRICSWIWRMS